MYSFQRVTFFGLLAVGGLMLWRLTVPAAAQDKKGPDPAALERTRETVKMLDDLYKTAVVTLTNKYVEDQASTPAAVVAKEVFQAMHKKGWHSARLVDASGKPKNKDNVAKTDFEKKAVEEMKAGKPYYEEVGEKEGKPVLRAATVATHAGRAVDSMRHWALAVQARSNHNKATCALANKLARICYATLRDGEPYGADRLQKKVARTAFALPV